MRLEVVDHAGGGPPRAFDDADEATTHAFARAKGLALALGCKLDAGRYRGGILLLGWDEESSEGLPLVWLGPGSSPLPGSPA